MSREIPPPHPSFQREGNIMASSAEEDARLDAAMEQAAAWYLQLQSAPADTALRDAQEEWLARDPLHAEAWALAAHAWRLSGELPAATPVLPAPILHRPATRRSRRWLIGGASAMAAGIALATLLPETLTDWRADLTTGTADRTVTLPDGSLLALSAGSAAGLDFTATLRRIHLLRGAAYVEVMRDPARPFRLDAGEVQVEVTGTRFALGMSGNSMNIAVAEGRVRVSQATEMQALAAGDSLFIDRSDGSWRRGHTDISAVASWRQGRLSVSDMPLPDVANIIARYRGGRLLIASEALRERRVTGVYDLRQPDRALRALVAPYGGTLRSLGPFLAVLSAV
ncbi:sigma factor regulatory protein, FecR/PupR family [Acetobacteraceae bacterium AT-5844]|nr:sigma factor regulatory protein, FecR/PupR family [Acetobacteraceae bacterium AT-5844]